MSSLADVSLAVNALAGAASSPGFMKQAGWNALKFKVNVSDMRAAIDDGYFTLRPNRPVTGKIDGGKADVMMEQINTGRTSEIQVFKAAFGQSRREFSMDLMHELIHSTRANESLAGQDKIGTRWTTYNSDPAEYYKAANPNAYGLPNQKPIPGTNIKPEKHDYKPVDTYAVGHLFEGGVNNWYARQVLRKMKMY